MGLCRHGHNSGLRIFFDIIRKPGTRILMRVTAETWGMWGRWVEWEVWWLRGGRRKARSPKYDLPCCVLPRAVWEHPWKPDHSGYSLQAQQSSAPFGLFHGHSFRTVPDSKALPTQTSHRPKLSTGKVFLAEGAKWRCTWGHLKPERLPVKLEDSRAKESGQRKG